MRRWRLKGGSGLAFRYWMSKGAGHGSFYGRSDRMCDPDSDPLVALVGWWVVTCCGSCQ